MQYPRALLYWMNGARFLQLGKLRRKHIDRVLLGTAQQIELPFGLKSCAQIGDQLPPGMRHPPDATRT